MNSNEKLPWIACSMDEVIDRFATKREALAHFSNDGVAKGKRSHNGVYIVTDCGEEKAFLGTEKALRADGFGDTLDRSAN
jgi:hypothetical protein